MMKTASSERHFQMYETIRKGATDEEIFAATYEKAYVVQQMRELDQLEDLKLKDKKLQKHLRLCAPAAVRRLNVIIALVMPASVPA